MARTSRRRVAAWLAAVGVIVAACGGAATPTPAPTATPAPTPAPTPTPTPVDVAAVFLAQLTGTDTGRLPVTGSATFGELPGTISGMLESAGRDRSASSLTITIADSPQVNEGIRIGTKKWTRENGGVWILDPEPADAAKSISSYLRTLTTLDDKGVETKDGRELHHLVPPAGAELTPEAMGLGSSIKDPTITVDFWAEPDGTPALMAIDVAWSQAAGSATVPVTLTMEIDLSGLGTPATIEEPADAWTGYRSERFGYSIAFPEGWSASEGEGTDAYLLDGQPYIYVTPQELDAGYTLERFHDELVAYYRENDIEAKPAADEEYAVDGTPARALTYRYTDASGVATYIVDVVTVRGGTGWEIYLIQEQVEEEASRAFFDQVVATFSFEE